MAAFVFGLLITAMAGSVLWLLISRKVGKFFAWQAFNALNAATNLIFLFAGEGDNYLIILAGFLNGLPVRACFPPKFEPQSKNKSPNNVCVSSTLRPLRLAGLIAAAHRVRCTHAQGPARYSPTHVQVGGQFLVNTIMADVIDYDEFLNGARSEAAFSVFATLIPKFVAIPASAVPLAVINLLGFVQPVDGVAQVQNDGVHRFIRAAFILVPFTCAVGSFIVKFRYPIKTDTIAEAVQMGIEEFKEGKKLVRRRVHRVLYKVGMHTRSRVHGA